MTARVRRGVVDPSQLLHRLLSSLLGAQGAVPGAVRPATLGWALGVGVFALLYGGMLLLLGHTGVEDVARRAAGQAGVGGVALVLGAMAVAVMTPLPDGPVALAALVAYGPLGGLALVLTGSWVGAMADFVLVRTLARSKFRRRFPGAAHRLDGLLADGGVPLLVLLRIVPTVSFDALSYAAALSRVGIVAFAAATLLGLLPGPTIAALVGAGVGGGDLRLTLGLGIVALLVAGALVVVHRAHRRTQESDG